ncbi:hypothetical protein [Bacillus pseudomycoides]|uniref:hypothetical protein n=1 Tax=Bacillus pseudomycoides TaxID=64104 RepID=UPI0015CF2288|nr:hypothetical protein [Bacillus pseudomycoides]MED4654817.1 hypothetical protein [Bacillus pseudomycoides]
MTENKNDKSRKVEDMFEWHFNELEGAKFFLSISSGLENDSFASVDKTETINRKSEDNK